MNAVLDALRLPGSERFTELLYSRFGQVLLGAVAGALIGAIIVAKLTLLVMLVGAIIAATAATMALVYPGRVFIALILIMSLIPTYAAPEVGSLLFIPAAGLSWVLAGVLAWRNAIERGRIFRFTGLDVLVLVFFALLFISMQYSAQIKFQDFLNNVFAWLGPFLAARLLLQEVKRPTFTIATGFAIGTVLVAPVALLETAGVKNPFLNFQYNAAEAATWASSSTRLGAVRAEASFGHPIALSMFVSVSAVLSLAMAIYAKDSKDRGRWIVLSAIGVGVQVMTFSRTGWLILSIGILLLALTAAVRAARTRLSWVISIAGIAVFALMLSGNAPSALQIIPSSSGGSGEEAEVFRDSGAYREKLLERALEPGVLGLWGNPYNKVTRAVSSTNNATDNAYIILADGWGLIPTFSLFAIAAGLLVAIMLAKRRRAGPLVALPIAAITSLASLFFVAFITQQQVMIWILIGASSAASERALQRSRGQIELEDDPERADPEAGDQRFAAAPVRW